MGSWAQPDDLGTERYGPVVAIVSDMVERNMNRHDGLHNCKRGHHCIEVTDTKKALINAGQLSGRCKLPYGTMEPTQAKLAGPELLYAD